MTKSKKNAIIRTIRIDAALALLWNWLPGLIFLKCGSVADMEIGVSKGYWVVFASTLVMKSQAFPGLYGLLCEGTGGASAEHGHLFEEMEQFKASLEGELNNVGAQLLLQQDAPLTPTRHENFFRRLLQRSEEEDAEATKQSTQRHAEARRQQAIDHTWLSFLLRPSSRYSRITPRQQQLLAAVASKLERPVPVVTQVQIKAVRKAKGSPETVLGKVRFPKLEHCFITKKVAAFLVPRESGFVLAANHGLCSESSVLQRPLQEPMLANSGSNTRTGNLERRRNRDLQHQRAPHCQLVECQSIGQPQEQLVLTTTGESLPPFLQEHLSGLEKERDEDEQAADAAQTGQPQELEKKERLSVEREAMDGQMRAWIGQKVLASYDPPQEQQNGDMVDGDVVEVYVAYIHDYKWVGSGQRTTTGKYEQLEVEWVVSEHPKNEKDKQISVWHVGPDSIAPISGQQAWDSMSADLPALGRRVLATHPQQASQTEVEWVRLQVKPGQRQQALARLGARINECDQCDHECGIPLDDESSTRLVEQGWAYRKAEEEATREAVELARSNPEQAALWQQEARQ
eukprot:g2477.t1